MRRYADPDSCPDCGGGLISGVPTCPRCNLELSGPLGIELFSTLTRADQLLEQMRRRSQVTAVTPPPATRAVASASAAPPAPVVRGSSVPQILLGLGAVCLLVAALVFLAVTWSRLGVGGRTATLVGFTAAIAVLTSCAARRALRGATEALGVVALGLALLDLYGAEAAGWFGDPTEATMAAIAGAALLAAGLGATTLLSRTRAAGFTGGELTAAFGAALLSAGVATQDWGSIAARQLFVVCLVLGVAAAVWSRVQVGSNRFRVVGWFLVPVAVLDWVALVLIGLEGVGGQPTAASAWAGLDAWPLVAAAAVAAVVALAGRLPVTARVASAAAGLVPLGLAALAPAFDEPTTTGVLAVAALAAALLPLMVLAPRPWDASGLLAAALCAAALAAEAAYLLATAVDEYVSLASAGWTGSPGERSSGAAELGAERWLLPLCAALLCALTFAAARAMLRRTVPLRAALAATTAVLAVSGPALMLLHPVPVWTVLLVGLLLSAAAALPALLRDNVASVASAVAGAAGLLATVALSWYDELPTAATLLATLVVVTAVHLLTRRTEVAAVSAALMAAVLAGLVWTAGVLLGVEASWSGVAVLVALSVLVLGRPYLPAGPRSASVRVALDVSGACVAAGCALAALDRTNPGDRSVWLAVDLTVAGVAVTLLALLRHDRRPVAWLGGLLLAAATWVRLADLGVVEPEPYTLPSAAVLLVAGLVHLRRRPSASTHLALGPGLSLALLPSMVWVVTEPTGPRPVLLGLVCLALVVAGTQVRWAAPLAYGAAVGLAVVVREAAPYVGAGVPRWALIGAAGALLIAMGVSWEQRMRDARLVTAYVRGLR